MRLTSKGYRSQEKESSIHHQLQVYTSSLGYAHDQGCECEVSRLALNCKEGLQHLLVQDTLRILLGLVGHESINENVSSLGKQPIR